jgi:uncharacterized membrane protein
MNLFTQCYRGEASLAKAFWVIYVLILIFLNLIAHFILINFLISEPAVYKAISIVLNCLILFYTFFAFLCVWRCGKNSKPIWDVLSKIVVILGLAVNIFYLINAILIPVY